MKETRFEDVRVEVYPADPWFGTLTDKERQEKCHDLLMAIRRHVDGIGTSLVTRTTNHYCSHCGRAWTEYSDECNGGCCDEDAKNLPAEEIEQ